MKFRLTFFAAVFFMCLATAFTAEAQRGNSGAKFRGAYKRKFRPSWTVFASPGIAVMNSENEGDPGNADKVGVLKNNGMGPTLSIGALYQFSHDFGVEGRLGYLNFNGKEDARARENININDVTFKTNAVEASASLVYNLTNTYVGSRFTRSRNLRLLVPYVKAGVGLLAYKSSSSSERLGVEYPEATDYPDIALVTPVGGGIKIQYSKQLTIAPELNVYFTTSDYLDNTSYGYVSPLTGSNDAYLSATIKVMYNITAHRRSPFRIRR
ncbi:outer membrane beta-barrel protein [Pontibacter sp. BT310]|uniref:Outer membrane beta-barrel protein n=1 Tax=Pontibacter populi TaxID=890055 RepID=A0ABS6XFU3_9BACT|nr:MULTISPECIES: outer membrane beta-barrel protein [Pontibacter]MBJ6119196.1 outer membrane beta-barrel protein [Pontibacter sp. BT310]MBR0571624.1 outer membrane beta-barrel protein [Microvirga sp. STS03]MBW3366050.1 outer membrane beta-barrel protein [Pontibacter populi]